MIQAIISNIFGFDLIVIILIVINIAFIYTKLKTISEGLNRKLVQVRYLSVDEILKTLKKDKDKLDLNELKKSQGKEDKYYQAFVSITSILPLLGILGTVISLMNINEFSSQVISNNFMTALTSTFWGLIGAIICKGLEGTIIPKITANNENLNMLFKGITNKGDVEVKK